MKARYRGITATLASAFLFGVTPILGRLSYEGGSNAAMLSTLRGALALPVLLVILLVQRIPLRITRRNMADLALMGTFGSAATGILFNSAYQYIPVGLATVLNCTYPFFVIVISQLFLRERATRASVLALLTAMAGVAMFSDLGGGGQLRGVLMALASAITFAFVMLYQYRSSLIDLPPAKLSFYLCIVTSVDLLVFSLLTGQFTLSLTPTAWGYTFIVAVSVSALGLTLLQYGLQHVGSTTASILSMLEPITSVVCGVLLLGEPMTWVKLAGGLLVLGAIALLTLAGAKQTVAVEQPAQEDNPSEQETNTDLT